MQINMERPGAANAGAVGISSFSDKTKITTEYLAKAIEGVAVEVVSFGDFFSDEERARAFKIGSISALGGIPVSADLAFLGNAYSRLLRVGGVE